MSIVAALAAAVAAVAVVAETSPARSDLAAEASAGNTKFVSKRYGYVLVLTGGYVPKYARTGWTGHFPLVDSGEVDVFMASPDRFFIVAATRLPTGTTLPEWEKSHAEVVSGFAFCRKARAFRNTSLGGTAAREFLGRCLTHDAIVVVSLHGGRGYTFQYVWPKRSSAADARRIFEAGRRTFRFTQK